MRSTSSFDHPVFGKMLGGIDVATVQRAFREAREQLDLGQIAQRDLKKLTVVAIDRLCGLVRPDGAKLELCANRLEPKLREHLEATKLYGIPETKDGKPIGNTAECMVDVHVSYAANGDAQDPYHTVCTAESEGYHAHGIAEGSSSNDNGYLWDLYKLLQVPSPLRIFVARTRDDDVVPLTKHIDRLVRAYAHLYRADDRIFAVVMPAPNAEDGRFEEARYLGWARGTLALHPPQALG